MNQVTKTKIRTKYATFIKGIIFATLGTPFLIWGISVILKGDTYYMDLIYPFIGILSCLFIGMFSMLHGESKVKEKMSLTKHDFVRL